MTIAELLAPFGIDETQFTDELARALGSSPNPAATSLNAEEESILGEYGGFTATVTELPAANLRSEVLQKTARMAVANLAVLTRESLSVDQAASLLKIDPTRVRHRVRDKALYGFRLGASLRLPTWQFTEHDTIPGLRAILAALPEGLHPLEVTGVMTNPDPDLAVGDTPTAPRDWLSGGGDVATVTALIHDLDTW